MAKWIAREVVNGSIKPAEATFLAADLHFRTDHEYSSLLESLSELHEPMIYLDTSGGTLNGSTYDEVAAEVVAEARRLLAESPAEAPGEPPPPPR